MKKMLLILAHPDDESFVAGGTVAKYVKDGWRVDLICATRGEVGETGPYGEKTERELGVIREGEVRKAAEILGISSVTFLDYIDGTLANDPPGKLEDILCKQLEEIIPDCVITFDTTGISNHPDHIRVSYAATFAFQKYAAWIEKTLKEDPEYDEDAAPKLYYACVPETVCEYLKKKKVFSEESFGRPWLGVEDKFITTLISTAGFQMIKKKALKAHISQQEDTNRFLSLKSNPLISHEYFIFRMHGTQEIFMGKNDRISSKL
jgi:N-acetylglucosamine malate deacetylase 2